MIKVAIVGGGPSAACLIEAFAHYAVGRSPVGITVFEPSSRLWHGYAFQPDGDEILANVPMKAMSLRSWDTQHGVRWLHDNGHGSFAEDTTYPPRWLVGRYLHDTARRACAALAAAGCRIDIEPLTVNAVEHRDGKLLASGDGWSRGPFDHAVLCVGATPSHDPYLLSGEAGYISSAYPVRSWAAEVAEDADVAIIGSGLTAVDAVMGLRARGHRGRISLVSRNGILPSVRAAPVEHRYNHLTLPRLEALARRDGRLRLSDVAALAEAELRDIGGDFQALIAATTSVAPAAKQLQRDLDQARAGDLATVVLRNRMVPCGQDAYYLLREEDQARVRAHHQILMRLCCPMPLSTGERLAEMFGTGQLESVPGATAIQRRQARRPQFEVHAAKDLTADVVIGATTPATLDPPPAARPLLLSLTSQRLAVRHPFGGVQIERKTSRLLDSHGVPDPRLHALGHLTGGAYLFTSGMPVLVARANGIARDILGISDPAGEEPVGAEGRQRASTDQVTDDRRPQRASMPISSASGY